MGNAPNSDSANEPVAIIGLSCKFAGDASNPENLWRLLTNGRTAWLEVPSSRFCATGAYQPNPEKINVYGGHFIKEDIGLFDAAFFNYSAELASTLDPQIRLQLESVYEALENAGIPLTKVAGSNTSVLTGPPTHDYHGSTTRDEENLPRFPPTDPAMASNWISHFFDLRGKSMSINTGCSTTALHLAILSLRSGEVDMSIVGGSNLMLNPDMIKTMNSSGFLSPDGEPFTVNSLGNDCTCGDGVATIVVKRLRDALAANDPIRAVIRETQLETIISPSEAAQMALVCKCYRMAGLALCDTQYFEVHSRETSAGNSIEVSAIAAMFGKGRPASDPLRIGSIMTSIGYTGLASGLASVIKVTIALEKGIIPPSINFELANPKPNLEDWYFKVVENLEPWPSSVGGIRRASINSFGYSRSSAHVILEHGESWTRVQADVNRKTTKKVHAMTSGSTKSVNKGNINGISGYERPKYKAKVFALSARDEQACQRMVSNLREHLEQNRPADPEIYLQSLAYTLGQRRTMFPWVAAHTLPYTCGIDEVISGLASPNFKPKKTSAVPRIGMVFTGLGAQWHGMGRELIIPYPVFKASLEEADEYLKSLGTGWSLMEELCRDSETTRINNVAISVVCSVALQISLVQLLRSWGVKPTAVTSHSSGEIAAAYTVGALSYREALAVAYYRGVLVDDKNPCSQVKGDMVAVELGLEDTERYLRRLTCGGKAVAAYVNSPSSVTVSGDFDAVAEIEAMVKKDGVSTHHLGVDIGFNSHHMRSIADPYHKALSNVFPWRNDEKRGNVEEDMPNSIPFSSPLLGGRVFSLDAIRDPVHWVDSLVQPVQFVNAFTDMVLGDCHPSSSSVDVIIEVGPQKALSGPIRQILEMANFKGIQLSYYGCLARNADARDSMQELAASLMQEGLSLDMDAINFPWGRSGQVKVLTDLPSYPWNHQIRY